MALQRRIAVVGGGVAGLFAASCILRSGADVTLYEKATKLGGDADTRTVHGIDVGSSSKNSHAI
jgi:phytoene dehydrogenase-like protein